MINPATRARLFHAQYESFRSDLPFWLRLAREVGEPILEMGCGTGRLVRALAGRGYRVLGLDHDEAMIASARSHLPAQLQERVTWIEQDLASLSWKEPIHLAIGALNTFSYLSDHDFCRALSAVASILVDQGLIALDLPPYDPDPTSLQTESEPIDVFDDPMRGTSIELRAQTTQHTPQQVLVTWMYDELFPDGKITRHLWEQMYFQRSEETVRRLVHASGLSVRALYGDYQFSTYREGSERLLVIIAKTK